jgi:hypothetical protein
MPTSFHPPPHVILTMHNSAPVSPGADINMADLHELVIGRNQYFFYVHNPAIHWRRVSNTTHLDHQRLTVFCQCGLVEY